MPTGDEAWWRHQGGVAVAAVEAGTACVERVGRGAAAVLRLCIPAAGAW